MEKSVPQIIKIVAEILDIDPGEAKKIALSYLSIYPWDLSKFLDFYFGVPKMCEEKDTKEMKKQKEMKVFEDVLDEMQVKYPCPPDIKSKDYRKYLLDLFFEQTKPS